MVYKNQNYMTNRKIKEEIDKNQKGYEAEETPVFEPELYYFLSYADAQGETYWGHGTVETTEVTEDGYTQVEIKTNDPDQSFVGQKVFLASDANADGQTVYPVYSDAGKTSMNLYVKVSKTEITVKEPEHEEEPEHETYKFKSYSDNQGTVLWGTGSVETTGITSNGYIEVEVIENSTDQSFVGQKFFVLATAEPDDDNYYQLYTDAGTTETGIYVKIFNKNTNIDNEDNNNHGTSDPSTGPNSTPDVKDDKEENP